MPSPVAAFGPDPSLDSHVAIRGRRATWGVVGAVLFCLLAALWWGRLTPGGRSPVQGRVQAGGRVVTFGTVTVIAADGTVHTTAIRPDGTYSLPHVPPGPIRVGVSSPEPKSVFQKSLAAGATASARPAAGPGGMARRSAKPGKSGKPDGQAGKTLALRDDTPPPSTQATELPAHEGWFRLPGRYADPARSGLEATVGPQGSTVDLALDPVRD